MVRTGAAYRGTPPPLLPGATMISSALLASSARSALASGPWYGYPEGNALLLYDEGADGWVDVEDGPGEMAPLLLLLLGATEPCRRAEVGWRYAGGVSMGPMPVAAEEPEEPGMRET